MSFVHCPSCHRAFDLRRHASCVRCAAPSTEIVGSVEPASSPASSCPEGNAAEHIVSMVAELAALIEAAPSEALEAAQQQLARRGLAAPKPTRWLPTGESLVRRAARRVRDVGLRSLAAAAHDGAGAPAPVEVGSSNGPDSRSPSGSGGAARAVATRVASRLRSAWAGLGNPPA
jgi:hypothetical protein